MRNLLQQVAQPLEHRSTFIYALVDPRNQAMRYIGKSVNPKKRFATHLSKSSLKKESHKNHWIKELLRLGLKPELELIDEVDYRDSWANEEVHWIARIRGLYPGYPALTNATNGGEGIDGCVMPEDIRKKISKANRGVPKSVEARLQFSLGQANRWKNSSEEEKQTMLSNLRHEPTIEQRTKISKRARNADRPANTASRYRNVVKDKQRNEKCWRVGFIINGKQICVGYYRDEEDAAIERDKYALKYIGEEVILNFPRENYEKNPENIVMKEKIRSRPQRSKRGNISGYMGVTKNGKNGWTSGFSHKGVRYRLGTCRTPEEAARRYDLKAIELLGEFARTNFPRSDYE